MSAERETSCEYCNGTSNPKLCSGAASGLHRLLFCIRGRTLVIRDVDAHAKPQWLLTVVACPVCGREL